MRIIAGQFRSRILVAPRGMDTRPTSDRLRETLFNVLQPRLAGARFLDLYAGSGANGFEALSRGAGEAVFVEQAALAIEALRKNVAALGVSQCARVESQAVALWLANALRISETRGFDVIFLDPPYDAVNAYVATLTLLGASGAKLLAPGGIVIAEHRRARSGKSDRPRLPTDAAFSPAERYGTLRRMRVLEQGEAALSFYQVQTSELDGLVKR